MTYTVKNGTWCKDNQGEYLSTTITGLRAMQKAGSIPSGTRVVIHERRYEPAQLISSLNPNPPEGFFVPDGSEFDTEVYQELAEIFPDGKLPDLRECTFVTAGKNTSFDIRDHDVYEAKEFKDDQTQLHVHSRGTMNIEGRFCSDSNGAGLTDGAFYNISSPSDTSAKNTGRGVYIGFDASRTWTGQTSNPEAAGNRYVAISNPEGNPQEQGWYEIKYTFTPTSDTTINSSKEYYKDGVKVTDLYASVNPASLDLYEYNETSDEYVGTLDTSVVPGKVYYVLNGTDYEEANLDVYVNPSALGWSEVTDEEYILTTDTYAVVGKTYYKFEDAQESVRTGATTHGKQYGVYRYIAF